MTEELNLSYVKSLGILDLPELAIKKIGNDTIQHYVALWGNKNMPDMEREYFTEETDFWDEPLKDAKRPLTWDHAQDEETKADPIIGDILEVGNDKVGKWAISKLKRAHQYRRAVDMLIEKKAIGTSSDSANQYVIRVPQGKSVWLKRWPLFAAALTEMPCEPRMVETVNWKSIGIEQIDPEASEAQVREVLARADRFNQFSKLFYGD